MSSVGDMTFIELTQNRPALLYRLVLSSSVRLAETILRKSSNIQVGRILGMSFCVEKSANALQSEGSNPGSDPKKADPRK